MKRYLFIFSSLLSYKIVFSQFPLASTLTTGQGTVGTLDSIWTVSSIQSSLPTNTNTLSYFPAVINSPCSGAWVDPISLTSPLNTANWISSIPCSGYLGYEVYRLTFNLPTECNGISVTTPGAYFLQFFGYVDNVLEDVRINNVSEGLNTSFMNFLPGTGLSFLVDGPWNPGINTLDFIVYNGGGPGGFLLGCNSSNCIGSLPLELIEFDVSEQIDSRLISWQLTNDQNIENYIIEKSEDAQNWSFFKSVKSKKEINASYQVVDFEICKSEIYYRLKKVSTENETNGLGIKISNCDSKKYISIWPNPNDSGLLSIQSDSKIEYVKIYSTNMKLVYEDYLTNNSKDILIDVKNFSCGVYFVEINGDFFKFMKT